MYVCMYVCLFVCSLHSTVYQKGVRLLYESMVKLR